MARRGRSYKRYFRSKRKSVPWSKESLNLVTTTTFGADPNTPTLWNYVFNIC